MDAFSEPDQIDVLLRQSPLRMQRNTTRCCCGRSQCAILAHNNAALEGLEKDLLSAAQIGQALLVRHESHMAEAEAERFRMTANIEKLEADKKELEASNATHIQENRSLLDQLEGLNNLVSDSDSQIHLLTATLQSTRQELYKLTALAGRAASLEAQLTSMEVEQIELQVQLASSNEVNRSAMQRWKRAEGTIGNLQVQIDRIEKEAMEERKRHVEVMARIERRRIVDDELGNATGRLERSGTTNHMDSGKVGMGVVSHFVKDILQDNANLQMGVVELREMLIESNVEVENLREQLQIHQPLEDRDELWASLQTELVGVASTSKSRQRLSESRPKLHVHHHYHGPELIIKKTKKKRPSVNSGHVLSSSGTTTPRARRIRDWRAGAPSSAATILSQTVVTVPPQSHQQRWSVQSSQTASSFAPSSVPSSPRRTSSIFDNIEGALGSSRPTSPESSAPGSPRKFGMECKFRPTSFHMASTPVPFRLKDASSRDEGQLSLPASQDKRDEDANSIKPSSSTHNKKISISNPSDVIISLSGQDTIPEETDLYGVSDPAAAPSLEGSRERPRLHRSTSHESLLSLPGMEIHNFQMRPSQAHSSVFGPRSKNYATCSYTKPIASSTIVTGIPMFERRIQDSGEYTRSLLDSARNYPESRHTLGRRMGDWVWSKWGIAQVPSLENSHSRTLQSPLESMLRSPGVNQKGPILGMRPPKSTPSNVRPFNVNTTLLEESLADV